MYGTTNAEAFHSQLKPFFRNVMIQTRRNATVVCMVATLAKLVVGTLTTVPIITERAEHELLRDAANFFMESPLVFTPRVCLDTIANEKVDEDALPASAKRLRKRPAAQT